MDISTRTGWITMKKDNLEQKIGWFPLLLSLLCLSTYPIHWHFFFNILTPEDGIIEYFTALIAFTACLVAIALALSSWKQKNLLQILILLVYAGGCLFFAGEEISWGQRIFNIKTEEVSPWLAQANRQEELNLHNIRGIAQVRLLADVFCVVWGIIIPWRYTSEQFPLQWLRPFFVPKHLIPAFCTTIFITWPQKISELIFGEIQWVSELRLGEFKEFCFAWVCLFFSIHLFRSWLHAPQAVNSH